MTPSLDELHQAFNQLLTPAPAAASTDAPNPTGPPPSAEAPTVAGSVVPAPEASADPVPSCRIVEGTARGYHFDATVAPEQLVAAARLLDARGFAIDAVTGVDWLAARRIELVYDFYHPVSPLHVVLRCRVCRDGGEVPTVSEVFPGANWHERETHDFFGVRFAGHPDLTPFLLPEDADYHPLRKDFPGAA
ncbi:MAG: NADH-quinone oxidoreductase subunit C [Verrucomicrobiales bacterium]|nr:NADH-quinone oxidoreductase subunit C [Verrucomicrobiales bacterium]